jgi:hypothetical protein
MVLTRKSEAQANAEALARRSSAFADANRRSIERKADRGTPPGSLRALVVELRKAYRDEVPGAIHKHDVDGGGTPAYSGEFAAYLYGSPWATDKDDDTYRTPFRAALAGMHHSNPSMAAIVGHVTIGGEDPVDAVRRHHNLDSWMCRAIAERALLVFWQRCSDIRLDLRAA